MDVRGQHRQRHDAGEILLSVAPHPVEATVLQVADGRPARGVGAPRPAFPDAVRLRQPAPAGHRVGSGIPAGPNRSGGTVRTPVEAHHLQVGEPGPRLPAHGDRHVHVAPLPHDGTVREESVTVPGTRTGTPGSSGTPAFPFDIQRVCGPEVAFPELFPEMFLLPPAARLRPDAASDLRGCLAFDAITAVRVRDLQLPARESPDSPAERHVSPESGGAVVIHAAYGRVIGQRAPPEPDRTVARHLTPVAGLAGFRPTKRQPLPGTRKPWQGLRILNVAETHARAIRARTERRRE